MRWCSFWLLLGLWLGGPATALPLCVELEVRREITVEGERSEEPPEMVKVVLAADYLEIEDRDGRLVHDFLSYRSHLVKGEAYLWRSLYAELGFRIDEFANRLGLLQRLRQSDPGAMPNEEVSVEHLFSIDDELTEANISKSEGKIVSYRHKGKLLAEYSSSGTALSPAQCKAFIRFLRYYSGGHPDILSDLQVKAILPETLRIDVDQVTAQVSYRMRLIGARACDPPRPDFSALRLTELPGEPLGTLVALGLQLKPEAVEDAAASLSAQAEQAMVAGDMLEAALLNFEVLLMQGQTPPEALTTRRAEFEADPDTRMLFEALVTGPEKPAQAAATFEVLEARTNRAHVLKIFRAGMLLAQGQDAEARELYLQALMVNPSVAGAWKDLGDIYRSDFDMQMAWLCWDIGRRLSPQHAMLHTITQAEKMMRDNYPGFF
jgi:tetratricopeptide (TPR) repeat protein